MRLCFPYSIDMLVDETFTRIGNVTNFKQFKTAEEARLSFEKTFKLSLSNHEILNSNQFIFDNQENDNIEEDDENELNPSKIFECDYERLVQERYQTLQNSQYIQNNASSNKKSNIIQVPCTATTYNSESDSDFDSSENENQNKKQNKTDSMLRDVKIKFATKKNNKPVFKDVVIPSEAHLAVEIINRKKIEKDEMKQIKSLVLNLDKIQMSEETLLQKSIPFPQTLNRNIKNVAKNDKI